MSADNHYPPAAQAPYPYCPAETPSPTQPPEPQPILLPCILRTHQHPLSADCRHPHHNSVEPLALLCHATCHVHLPKLVRRFWLRRQQTTSSCAFCSDTRRKACIVFATCTAQIVRNCVDRWCKMCEEDAHCEGEGRWIGRRRLRGCLRSRKADGGWRCPRYRRPPNHIRVRWNQPTLRTLLVRRSSAAVTTPGLSPSVARSTASAAISLRPPIRPLFRRTSERSPYPLAQQSCAS